MFVGNPVFPISFNLEQVAGLVEETLRKKNWRAFEKGEIKLVLTPFYIFYYDAVVEEEGKATGENRSTGESRPTGKGKASKESKRGRLALNGETAELGKEIAESMPEEEELVKELPDTYPLIVRKPLFSKAEAEKIALLKTASMLGADRDNVILTGFKQIYCPMWIAFVTVAGQTRQLEISGVTGQVFGEEMVPVREKGFVEITKETLQELKEPGSWLRYSKEIAEKATDKISSRQESRQGLAGIMHRPSFWISLALLVVLIALVMFY